jgi:hypothetical protein
MGNGSNLDKNDAKEDLNNFPKNVTNLNSKYEGKKGSYCKTVVQSSLQTKIRKRT